MMLMDLQMYHPDDILVKVDRAGMAVSLENRIPFLDRDLIEFAWTLPLKFTYSGQVGKRVLKKMLYRYVPEAMMDRPKKGFSVPVQEWIKNDGGGLRPWAEHLMDQSFIRRQGILNAEYVEHLWQRFMKDGIWVPQIWYILMFEEWCQKREQQKKGC